MASLASFKRAGGHGLYTHPVSVFSLKIECRFREPARRIPEYKEACRLCRVLLLAVHGEQ
jgi:hypothetical protein